MGTFGRPCFAKSKHRLSEKRQFFDSLSGNAENILHCRFFLHAEQNLQRECALVIPYKNERDYLLK